MEYLDQFCTKSKVPIHFMVVVCKSVPDRIFFTYQRLRKYLNPQATEIHCFDSSGQFMKRFFVFRGLNKETVIASDTEASDGYPGDGQNRDTADDIHR